MGTKLGDMLAKKASGASVQVSEAKPAQYLVVPIDRLEPDPKQPRKSAETDGAVEELAASIKSHGLLQPIIVSEEVGQGRYLIVAGERRFHAARIAGLKEVEVIVRTVAANNRLVTQLVENIHRQALRPVDEAEAYQQLLDDQGMTQRELAQRLGKSLASVNQALAILNLSAEVRADVQTSEHRVSKSVLLEAAKAAKAGRNDEAKAIVTAARAGEMTVKEARGAKTGKKKNGKKTGTREAVIRLETATVTIRFSKGQPSVEAQRSVLKSALATLK